MCIIHLISLILGLHVCVFIGSLLTSYYLCVVDLLLYLCIMKFGKFMVGSVDSVVSRPSFLVGSFP